MNNKKRLRFNVLNSNIYLMLIGCLIYGYTINQLKILNYGMGPFDTLSYQLTKITIIDEFGNATFVIHLFFWILLFFFRKPLKISFDKLLLSLVSIFFLTRIINILANVWYIKSANLMVFIGTFLGLNLGLFLIARSNLIIAPFDKFLVELANYWQINLGFIRITFDILMLIVAIILNYSFAINQPITEFTIFITIATGLNLSAYSFIAKIRIFKSDKII